LDACLTQTRRDAVCRQFVRAVSGRCYPAGTPWFAVSWPLFWRNL